LLAAAEIHAEVTPRTWRLAERPGDRDFAWAQLGQPRDLRRGEPGMGKTTLLDHLGPDVLVELLRVFLPPGPPSEVASSPVACVCAG
jgi:hypothetical protein